MPPTNLPLQPRHVLPDHRVDIGRGDRCRGALGLAIFGPYLTGQRNVDFGQTGTNQIGQPTPVNRVDIRVQQADRDGFGIVPRQPFDIEFRISVSSAISTTPPELSPRQLRRP